MPPHDYFEDALKLLYTGLHYVDKWNEPAEPNQLYKYGTFRLFDQTEFVGAESTKKDGQDWTWDET